VIMNTHPSRLEDLPNELLTDIFKNIGARNLFRSFHNLNYRLNQLIQSFQYLQLIFHLKTSNIIKTNDEIFPFYVHTLIVDPWINFNLNHFPNVRHLTLNNPLPKVLEQLKPEVMPYLEHLSISYAFNMYEMVLLHEKIFSNRFLHLKSCELFEKQSILSIQNWTQSPSIRFLKTEFIDSLIYTTILSACPNLYFFKFSMLPSNGMPSKTVQIHTHLKHMIIELRDPDWSYDDYKISGFLASVPNLKQFEIHRRNYSTNIIEHFEHYDWLASILTYRLPLLRKFRFYFHLSNDGLLIHFINEGIRTRIQTDFNNIHKGQYEARLTIDREIL
jgi:hypothetical protein